MHLVHLTDPHFGCEDVAALQAVVKYIEQNRPDAVICTGDISIDGRQSELDAACDWMRSLPVPVIVTPGNHDVPYYSMIGRIFFPWARFSRAVHGLRVEPWHTDEWSVVPINTARGIQLRANWAQGAISRRQIAEASTLMKASAQGALRIVITHHPLDWPNDAPIHGATIGGLEAQAELIEAGAQLFLSGHLHFASARLIGTRALSITSGTLSRRLRHEPCAFTSIRRPEPFIIEAEVIHIVQGVCETASTRQFRLSDPLGAPGPEQVHAAQA